MEERKDLIGRERMINAARADAKGYFDLAEWYRSDGKDPKPQKPYKTGSVPGTNLFLMWNMGNSGGSWFESICNVHPKVGAWEEPIRQIIKPLSKEWKDRKEWGVNKKLNMAEKKFEIFKDLEKSGNWETIGFVKSFRPYIHEYCIVREAVMVQMFRNPMKVVANKFEKKGTDTKKWMKRHWNVDLDINNKKQWFEGHCARFADLYQQYLDRQDNNMLIRLEDLSDALYKDKPYFKNTLEHITQVDWNKDVINKVKKLKKYKSNNKGNHSRDNSKDALWLKWKDWQLKIFKKYFDEIMKDQKYKYK